MPVITIDGPAAAGKGTVAKHLADNLTGFAHLDTGAVYRAMAYVLGQCGFEPGRIRSCMAPAAEAVANAHVGILLEPDSAGYYTQSMTWNTHPIPDGWLRTQDISELASVISEYGKFRSIAAHVIRKAADKTNLIVDGRDAGTVLFPGAPVKFYLWAPLEVRARRRQAQNVQNGREEKPLDRIVQEIKIRDERDSRRGIAPLRMAPDAVWINTDLFPEETLKRLVLDIASARLDPRSTKLI